MSSARKAFSGSRAVPHTRVRGRRRARSAAIALEEGFSVQPRKTRVMRRGTRQRLAGVVINRHPNLSRERFDTLTSCVRHGPASQNRDGHRDFRASLAGHVAHASMLNRARAATSSGRSSSASTGNGTITRPASARSRSDRDVRAASANTGYESPATPRSPTPDACASRASSALSGSSGPAASASNCT